MKHGEAVFKTRNGTYLGNFDNDYLDGWGSFIWNDGKVYEGEFKKTKFHGRGTILYPSNQIAEGEWEENHNKTLSNLKNDQSVRQRID